MVQMTEDAFRRMLAEKCKERGAQSSLAAEIGVSRAFVNDILHGNRPITDRISQHFGYKRVVLFVNDNPITAQRKRK